MGEKPDRSVLQRQRAHWQSTFEKRGEMFGRTPSYPARYAASLFEQNGFQRILELGAGQGRDTLYFARRGFEITALDYSTSALKAIARQARKIDDAPAVPTVCHDVKQPLPFDNETFDACFSHMLYCMALTVAELQSLSREIWRVLRTSGLNVYSARNTADPDYGQGIRRGEDMYESNGFIVHFFDRDKVAQLSQGYELLALEEFEEGSFPRRLFLVALGKNPEDRRGN